MSSEHLLLRAATARQQTSKRRREQEADDEEDRGPCPRKLKGEDGDAIGECHLETRELWQKFFDLGTEMIITKTGR